MPDETKQPSSNFETVSRIIQLLEPLTADDREHVLRTVTTWLRVPVGVMSPASPVSSSVKQANTLIDEKFSNRPVLSAKDFIFEKDPQTESERMACLGYYLTHFMETPHFKTGDLARLNTDAAQRRLSNPGVAANNATRDGFFVSASKSGFKQLSAMGERFVHALPNREAAQQMKQRMVSRRARKTSSSENAPEASLGVE